MKLTTELTGGLLALTIGLTACGGKTSPTANTAKPANTNTAANTAAPRKDEKAALIDSKRPDGKAKTASRKVPVPESWVYVYDSAKGYGFSVPSGSTGGHETHEGVDTFIALTPAPAEVGVVVITFKDKEMSKEDLLDVAEKFMGELGATVTAGELKGASEDYYVCEATVVSKDGKKSKNKILVGTDVTDNYVMIVGAEESKYAANLEIIDGIWGSFEMWSGGASGNN